MLFGNDGIQEKIILDVRKSIKKDNGTVIYGAMVGSISKGTQYCDSDYDTRFLYIDESFPEKIYDPKNMREAQIVKRYYMDGMPYEWIPCWEVTSFFNYLINPCIEGKLSNGLYNIVGWTLQSPYTWDPYGLQSKICPLINSIFESKYVLEYHLEQINKLWDGMEKEYDAKGYIHAVYSAMSIEWIVKYNSFPPVYLITLLATISNQAVRELLPTMIRQAQKNAEQCLERAKRVVRLYAVREIDEYMETMKKLAGENLKKGIVYDKETKNKIVNEIYNIINYSITQEQFVEGISNYDIGSKTEIGFKQEWEVIWENGDGEINLKKGGYQIVVKSLVVCRKVRIKFRNSYGYTVHISHIMIGNQDVSRIVTLNGVQAFDIPAMTEVYSDCIDLWLRESGFVIEVMLDRNEDIKENFISVIEKLSFSRI